MSRERAKTSQHRAIRRLFRRRFGSTATAVLGNMAFVDRVYELRCLIEFIRELSATHPGHQFVLSGHTLTLKIKGGPIDRTKYTWVNVIDPSTGKTDAEIWTNVEFWALSATPATASSSSAKTYGKAHELDLLLLPPGLSGRPKAQDILVGAEVKHRPYDKSLLKELLGVRREMMRLAPPKPNPWLWWCSSLNADPPSGLVAYCAYPNVKSYSNPAPFFGIRMRYLPL